MDESATRPDEKGFGLLNGKTQIGSAFGTKFTVFMGKVNILPRIYILVQNNFYWNIIISFTKVSSFVYPN